MLEFIRTVRTPADRQATSVYQDSRSTVPSQGPVMKSVSLLTTARLGTNNTQFHAETTCHKLYLLTLIESVLMNFSNGI